MASNNETFFNGSCFALVGDSEKMNFPVFTYRGLKAMSKKVYAIDMQANEIDGDNAYKSIGDLPETVDRIILELPKENVKEWVSKAAEAGIKDVWIHMGCDTPEAVQLADQKGINLRTGTCAVMYVTPGITFHSIHKWIMKLIGKY